MQISGGHHTYDAHRLCQLWLAAIAHCKWIDHLLDMKPGRFAEEDDSRGFMHRHDAIISATILDALLRILASAQRELVCPVKLHGLSIDEAAVRSGRSARSARANIRGGVAKMVAAATREGWSELLAP